MLAEYPKTRKPLRSHKARSLSPHPITSPSLLPVEIVPDYNRDGKITEEDRGKVTEENPYRFWVNDDDDKTDEVRKDDSVDTPNGGRLDSDDTVIDGIRDLVDFFPLHLDVKAAMEVFPRGTGIGKYKYYLKHEDSALKFVENSYTKLDQNHDEGGPAAYLRSSAIAPLILNLSHMKEADPTGVEIGSLVLEASKKGEGIIICEVTKETDKPLILEIRNVHNHVVARIDFPLKTTGVEKMYRHINLRSAAGGTGGRATEIGEPKNYPDDMPGLKSDKYFVFVHGYNVNGEQARGWHAETFKRMWWSGSKAKYVGVGATDKRAFSILW